MRRFCSSLFLLAAATVVGAQTNSDTASVAEPATRRLPNLRQALLHADADDVPPQSPMVRPAHRALFCRFDDALDREGVPLRMRLGTLEEVNRMEAKPGWRALPGAGLDP